MQERHPVDDLFRQGLEYAEVIPPAHVWAGIEERRKRRFVVWRFWLFGIAALLLGAGAVAWTQRTVFTDDLGSTLVQRSGPEEQQMHDALSTSSVGAAMSERSGPGTREGSPNEPKHTPANASPTASAPGPDLPAATTRTSPPPQRSAPQATHTMDPGVPASILVDVERSTLTQLELRHADLMSTNTAHVELRRAELPAEQFVLPKRFFWVSVQGGMYRTELDHSGRDQGLAAAWNKALSPGPDKSIALLGGISWRSGFGLSVGAEYHVLDQEFNYSDRRDSTVITTFTELTVLDQQVLSLSVDTFTAVFPRGVSGTGTLRTSAFVLPVEGHWHTPWRRWETGIRFGLAWEHLRHESGPALHRPTSEAALALLPGPVGGYPGAQDLISASAGLDLGYHLSERWSLWLSPTYQRGLFSLRGNDPYQVLPERLGIRTRITFLLP